MQAIIAHKTITSDHMGTYLVIQYAGLLWNNLKSIIMKHETYNDDWCSGGGGY